MRTARPLQTAYGISILSTENSGGGLPSFGVFSGEQIYTVYLDMRETEFDPPQNWTLEFAIASPPGQNGSGASPNKEGLILPFPAFKEKPAFPADVVRRYLRRMVIVFGVIDPEGKMAQIAVKESPDPTLNDVLVKCLVKWVFRPAQLNGQPVPAKILIGIPLSLQ